MGSEKNYRSRRFSIKWRFCAEDGKPNPELGWFYQVSKGKKSVRLLPADVEHFNKLLSEVGMQPVDPEWTTKVMLSQVTDRTIIPKVRLEVLSQATGPFTMSKQNQLTKLIFDYWTTRFPNTETHSVRSDQGGHWGAAKGTPARTGTNLYTKDGVKGRGTWMARPDVAVLDLQRKAVPYIAEVEAATHINPKVPAGLISTCNMCKWHYPPYAGNEKYGLDDAILFVVLCSESFSNPASKKNEQLLEFQSHFETAKGCLFKWLICSGVDVDAAFEEFQKQFEACIS